MKKIFLTVIALISMASASVFGMYGWDNDWMDFLVDGNQFRARMDQIGFTLGNDTIKGTFGFRANRDMLGSLFGVNSTSTLEQHNSESKYFDATISAGIGYTSSLISVGVGYNFTYIDRYVQVHTPVLALNAMDNNLRIVVPIQVAGAKSYVSGTDLVAFSDFTRVTANEAVATNSYLGVSMDPQIRYYTGFAPVSQIRLTIYYGINKFTLDEDIAGKNVSLAKQSFGFQFRLYGTYELEGVTVQPYVRIDYKTALGSSIGKGLQDLGYAKGDFKYGDDYDVTSISSWNSDGLSLLTTLYGTTDIRNPYMFSIRAPIGLGANSDIVSFWFEPRIGFTMIGSRDKTVKDTYAMNWGAYAEIYITPIQNLEWYFEADINSDATTSSYIPISFASTTGITWYLPEL